MPSYLIVANQTLSSPTLMAAVQERVDAEEAHFHVVVPATPVPHALTWDEREAEAAAQERLTSVLDRLKAMGADAAGEVGCADPVAATQDAIRAVAVDEIICPRSRPASPAGWVRTSRRGCGARWPCP